MPHFLLQTLPADKQWIAFAALGGAMLYVLWRMQQKKKKADPMADAPVRFPLSQQKAVEREMQTLLVQLSDMARELSAQIDTRSAKLEILLREADEKLAELRALTGGDGRSLPTFTERPAALPRTEEDPRHAAVYQLSDQGMNCQQIAQELGRHSGEVELILALRGKQA